MKSSRSWRRLRSAAGICLLALLPACSLLHHHKEDASAPEGRHTNSRGLAVELKASPDPVKLGETRQIDVTLVLRNTTKQTVSLKFATSQTIEIMLREQASGKVVSQWSTDQTFVPGNRVMVINSHERLEYNQPITTRELHPGVTYSLEAYFVGYEQELRASRPIIPLP